MFLSLRYPHDVQKSPRFGGAKFVRNHDRSGLDHVLGRPYCCVGAFAQVHDFEHAESMFGDLLIVRISSHGLDSLRPVGNVVTCLRRRPLLGGKAALQQVLRRSRDGIQYVEHAQGHGDKLFAAVCDLELEEL